MKPMLAFLPLAASINATGEIGRRIKEAIEQPARMLVEV